MSSVYLFPAIADSGVRLALNGGAPVGTGSTGPTSIPPYEPYMVSFGRVPKAQWSSTPTPNRLQGTNTLVVTSQNSSFQYTITVPDTYPDELDLVLYVYLGVALLLDPQGRPVPMGGGVFIGAPTLVHPPQRSGVPSRPNIPEGENMEATTYGKVYIFNSVNDEILALQINASNFPATVPAWSTAAATKYQPSEAVADRVQYPNQAQGKPVFVAGGTTTVQVFWQNFQGTFTVTSPDTLNYNVQSDLVLYITLGTAVLLDQTGRVVGQNGYLGVQTPQVISFTPGPAAKVAKSA